MAPGNKAAVTFYLTAAPVGPRRCRRTVRQILGFGGGGEGGGGGEERRGERKKAKQTEPWHNLPSPSGAGEQREKVPPRGGDHRRAEMKQEARSNLFVVAGTHFFFPSFFPPAAAKIKRKEWRGGKNEKEERHKYEETLVKRSGDFNGGCLWGAENKSNIVALVVGQWTRVGIFSCVACKK